MISEWSMRKARYIEPGRYEFDGDAEAVDAAMLNPLLSKHGITYFLSTEAHIPAHWEGDALGLLFEAGGEGLLWVNGVPYHGLDQNHEFVPLRPVEGEGGLRLDIELYDPIPEPEDPLNRQATIRPPIGAIKGMLVCVNKSLQSLLYTVTVAQDAARLLPEGDMRRLRIMDALHEAMDEVQPQLASRARDGEWLRVAEEKLAAVVRMQTPDQSLNGSMHMVGQSHIDIAWLWPVRETVRKVSRTFSTMTALMDEYPDFIYSQSQPLLYEFAKNHYPELYEKVKARVAEGRWELVGGMWVEPDLNIPSGEALVRQMLYGQRFYQEEFGRTSQIEWLPDTFGYCASLPQLLKLAGVNYFMTTKLNWNDTNKFPYDLFEWEGIDGTSIVSYLNHGLNEHTTPRDIHEHWESYRIKGKHEEQMLLYGHGDGGGGVTREMIEYVDRSSLMIGLPVSRFSTASKFFAEIGRRAPKLPRWSGDLYLELHRGTYTTHARNKRNNRKAEVLYREAEIWSRLADLYLENQAHSHMLHEGWKLILLNQFHDIIPGTAITETYETSSGEYDKVFAWGNDCLRQSLERLAGRVEASLEGVPYVVFNSLGWERSEIVTIEGGEALANTAGYDAAGKRLASDIIRLADKPERYMLSINVSAIPAFGYATIWLRPLDGGQADLPNLPILQPVSQELRRWETDRYVLEFNERYEITRWLDKNLNRELIKAGDKANEFQLFDDQPIHWDAWDIDPRFNEQRAGYAEPIGQPKVMRGETCDILSFSWKLNRSLLSQDLILYHDRSRVDFRTKIQWNEEHKLLKVAFPVDILAGSATYEIPFGAIQRPTHSNTSWEQAQYEVCGHRWADLSEGGYGATLLNDCKYGYDIKGRTLRLSLLRAPKWPDETADQGEHDFTYSLLPHEGSWRDAGVVRAAAELNHPVHAVAASLGEESETPLPSASSLIAFSGRHVLLDTMKAAEDGDGTILRMYESSGGREDVSLALPSGCDRAFLVNLLEEEIEELPVLNREIQLSFKPFEIKSVKWAE